MPTSVRFRDGAWPAVSSFQQTSYEGPPASGAGVRPGGDAVTSRYWQAKSNNPKVRRSPFEMASAYRRAASVAGLWTVARAFGWCAAAAAASIAELASQIVNNPPISNAAVSGLHRVMICACVKRNRTLGQLMNVARRPAGLTEWITGIGLRSESSRASGSARSPTGPEWDSSGRAIGSGEERPRTLRSEGSRPGAAGFADRCHPAAHRR